MSAQEVRILHYLNQFFGGIGGEDKAGHPLERREGPAGPAIGLEQLLGDAGTVVATLLAGDNFANDNLDSFRIQVKECLEEINPDVVVAGPAFNAGRYGMACAEVCGVASSLGIPSLAAMFPGNPAVDLFRQQLIIVPSDDSVAGMGEALERMGALALRMGSGKRLGSPEAEGYLPRGIRLNGESDRTAAERAVAMLLRKVAGKPFESEIPLGTIDAVEPAVALKEMKSAKLALISTAGLVPFGNPDQLKHVNEGRWRRYSIAQLESMAAEDWEPIHGGYDAAFVRKNPNLVVPLDAVRGVQRAGQIGDLFETYYAVVGVGAAVSTCERIGREIADDLLENGVTGVILTST